MVENSRATPPVDDVAVWVIPCITVRRGHRGKGVAVAMIRAAVDYAGKRGAPAVEAYVRAGSKRVHDDFAFFAFLLDVRIGRKVPGERSCAELGGHLLGQDIRILADHVWQYGAERFAGCPLTGRRHRATPTSRGSGRSITP